MVLRSLAYRSCMAIGTSPSRAVPWFSSGERGRLMAMVKTKRRSMSSARRRRIYDAHGGVCGFCHEAIDPCGGNRQAKRRRARKGGTAARYEIDHEIPLALGGSDDDGNCYPLHERCHEIKTFGLKRPGRQRPSDVSAIAKVKRLRDRRLGVEVKKRSRLSDPHFMRKNGGSPRRPLDGTVVRRDGGGSA